MSATSIPSVAFTSNTPAGNVSTVLAPVNTLSNLPINVPSTATCPVCPTSRKQPVKLINTQFISKDRGVTQHQLLVNAYSR